VHRNKIATQLQRPAVYEEEDARIGKFLAEKSDSGMTAEEVQGRKLE
jgi:hypothetical protein